jgi:hypothetical protein
MPLSPGLRRWGHRRRNERYRNPEMIAEYTQRRTLQVPVSDEVRSASDRQQSAGPGDLVGDQFIRGVGHRECPTGPLTLWLGAQQMIAEIADLLGQKKC